jgi:hypothetical protein
MKQLTTIIIGVLLALIILVQVGNGCKSGTPASTTVDVYRTVDTVWKVRDTVIYKKLTLTKTIHDTLPVQYLPSPVYDSLVVQYKEVTEKFLSKNVYIDSVTIPGCKGSIIINDTVQYNKLGGRSYTSTIAIPKITETITITKTEPPKGNLYIGGGISANKTAFQLIDAGLLLKNGHNQVYGVSVGLGRDLQPIYGVRMYWKIF